MDQEAGTSKADVESNDDIQKNTNENDVDKEFADNGENDEDDDDTEYEETYLYVDFETKLLEEQLMNPNLQIKVLGIETNAPIVQLNNKIFKGKCIDTNYRHSVSTSSHFISLI